MPEPGKPTGARSRQARSRTAPATGALSASAKPAFTQRRGGSLEGVTINLPTLWAARSEVVDRASSGVGFALFTMNLDHLAKIRSDPKFRAAYQRAALVSADGWPVVWLANRRGAGLERTCGSDLVEPVCKSAALRRIPVFFVGPERSSQVSALSALEQRYPGLEIVGACAPHISRIPTVDQIEAVAAGVNESGARLCFVCLGAPKQELLADALVPKCDGVGFLCVGAALDFISGRSRRAPGWWRRSGLEWLWRLFGDPRRLAARYLSNAFVFLVLAWGSRTETP